MLVQNLDHLLDLLANFRMVHVVEVHEDAQIVRAFNLDSLVDVRERVNLKVRRCHWIPSCKYPTGQVLSPTHAGFVDQHSSSAG